MHFLLKVVTIYVIFFVFPLATLAEFAPLKKDRRKTCNLQLSQAKRIPHQCQITTDTSSPLPVWQDRLSFHFGKLSYRDFLYLKDTYSGWSKSQSAIIYDPNKSYQLIDFLPPLIQAVNNHKFIPESTTVEPENRYLKHLTADNKKQLYMNCWGVVYEVLRAAINVRAKPAIFMGQGSIVLKQLRNNSHHLLSLSEPQDFPIPNQFMQPGNIILITHTSSTREEYLDHVAIAIDDGIYFEKAGTGAEVPIRIIDEATLRKIWVEGVFQYEVRRLNLDAILPHPQKVFSPNAPTIKQELNLDSLIPLQTNQNTTVMWEKEENSITTVSWFHLINTLPISVDAMGITKLKPKTYQRFLQ